MSHNFEQWLGSRDVRRTPYWLSRLRCIAKVVVEDRPLVVLVGCESRDARRSFTTIDSLSRVMGGSMRYGSRSK
jgi:hypothetical protein